jgi:hypothetical protein
MTLTYWAYTKVMITIRCCEYSHWDCIIVTSFSSKLIIRLNKRVCCITLGCKGLSETNTLTYWAYTKVMRTIRCCEYSLWYCTHTTSFSSQLLIRLNKQKRYITQGCKCLSETNTLANWAYIKVTKTMRCCEYCL